MAKLKNVAGWTKADIQQLIQTNDYAVRHALLTVFARQTQDEQTAGFTKYYNQMGFSAFDCEGLTNCANWLIQKGFLTPKQTTYVRKKIVKYAGQILEVMAASQASGKVILPPVKVKQEELQLA